MSNASIDSTRMPLHHADKLFIDGQWVAAHSGRTIKVICPATEALYMEVADADEVDIDRAVSAARKAFDEGPWPQLSHAERAACLNAMAEKLDARLEDVSSIWSNEMGITYNLAKTYSAGTSSIYKYYASLAKKFPFEEEKRSFSGAKVGILVKEPVGVVGAIIPWNGPISLIAFKIAPALLAGCTVVIKASPEAPGHALLMAEIAEEIGLPPGVVNVVTANREASEALVNNPGIDKITFTGSTAVGKRIAATMGARMGRYTLELGGKSAAIILDDYDVDEAARRLGRHVGEMTGQVCASITRVIVSRDRHDQFAKSLASVVEKLKIGDPFDPETDMGPLVTAQHRQRVESYIARGREEGLTLVTGGERPEHLEQGFYIKPTVFANVDNSSPLAQEEIFGPVICVIPADNEEHAIAIANDSVFGLNGSIFTNDVDKAYAIARRIRSGTVTHNAYRIDMSIAFGGFKQSGVGREGGVEGLLPFLETKTLLMEEYPSHLKRNPGSDL